uniref:Uncharacterized protein n=1 Tax=Glossina austeni TaxID=7395 RepID=A0A1A9VRY6_GLOAU
MKSDVNFERNMITHKLVKPSVRRRCKLEFINFITARVTCKLISEIIISTVGSTNRSCATSNESHVKRMETIGELDCTPDPRQIKIERSSMPTMPSPTILSIKPSFSRPSGSTTSIMKPCHAAAEQCGRH